jgi:hypothetical protein
VPYHRCRELRDLGDVTVGHVRGWRHARGERDADRRSVLDPNVSDRASEVVKEEVQPGGFAQAAPGRPPSWW